MLYYSLFLLNKQEFQAKKVFKKKALQELLERST